MDVGLSLGTNLGDRLANLKQAKDRIISSSGISAVTQSPVYETEPVDVPPEHIDLKFFNAIIIIETIVSIPQLMSLFQFIEQQIGRIPDTVRYSPRPMDIDIIYADQLQMEEDHVVIPHPRWTERRFVVQPLCDVRHDLIIPGQSLTVSEILSELTDKSVVELTTRNW